MSLRSRLDEDLKQALRAGDEVRKGTIRMLLASMKNQQIQNRAPLDDQQELSVVDKEVKVRREAAEEYERLGRPEIVEKNLAELSVLQEYLPAQLSEAEVDSIIREAMDATGASSMSDMGRVMGIVTPQTKGRTDGKLVSRKVRDALSRS